MPRATGGISLPDSPSRTEFFRFAILTRRLRFAGQYASSGPIACRGPSRLSWPMAPSGPLRSPCGPAEICGVKASAGVRCVGGNRGVGSVNYHYILRIRTRRVGRLHGQAYFCHRRCRQFTRQGPHKRVDRHVAGTPRAQGSHAEVGSVHQRRSGHDESLPAWRSLRAGRRQ